MRQEAKTGESLPNEGQSLASLARSKTTLALKALLEALVTAHRAIENELDLYVLPIILPTQSTPPPDPQGNPMDSLRDQRLRRSRAQSEEAELQVEISDLRENPDTASFVLEESDELKSPED